MAFLVLHEADDSGRKGKIIPREQALKLKEAMKHPDGLSEALQAKLANIKAIYIGKAPGGRTDGPGSIEPAEQQQSLTNIGVLQGKSEILPRGDRD